MGNSIRSFTKPMMASRSHLKRGLINTLVLGGFVFLHEVLVLCEALGVLQNHFRRGFMKPAVSGGFAKLFGATNTPPQEFTLVLHLYELLFKYIYVKYTLQAL